MGNNPNFPSRLLSYMQAKLPVLACTDPNTDIGKVIVEGGFGWWCESNDVGAFKDAIERALQYDMGKYSQRAFGVLQQKYHTLGAYTTILNSMVVDNIQKGLSDHGR